MAKNMVKKQYGRVFVEACKYSKTIISLVVNIFLAVWGVISTAIQNNVLAFIGIGTGLCLVIVFVIVLIYIKKIINGEVAVSIPGDKTIHLRCADYTENFQHIIDTTDNKALEVCCFVMGTDLTGNILNCSEAGVMFAMGKYLDENYTCHPLGKERADYIFEKYYQNSANIFFQFDSCLPSAHMVDAIDKYLYAETGSDTSEKKLSPGECAVLELTISNDLRTDMACNLLVVANSEMSDRTMDKINATHNTGDIIPAVFGKLKQSKMKQILIAVMGSNRLEQEYRSVFSQIIYQFARNEQKNIKDLTISVRQEDMAKQSLELLQLEAYTKACGDYYKNQNG